MGNRRLVWILRTRWERSKFLEAKDLVAECVKNEERMMVT
jgi:hypothetical protein